MSSTDWVRDPTTGSFFPPSSAVGPHNHLLADGSILNNMIANGAVTLNKIADDPWLPYTPTLTQGVDVDFTTSYAAYQQIGSTITVNVRLVCDTAGTAGEPVLISLPFTSIQTDGASGAGFIFDNSANLRYKGVAGFVDGTSMNLLSVHSTSPLGLGDVDFTAALNTDDVVSMTVQYEVGVPIFYPPPVPPPPGFSYGWDITTTNVGLPGVAVNPLTLPVYNGPFLNSTTYSLRRINAAVDLSGTTDVVIDRCWIQPPSSTGRDCVILGPGSIIKDCDLDGSAMQTGNNAERFGIYRDVGGTASTVERCRVQFMTIGAWLDGSSNGNMLTDTYMYNFVTNGTNPNNTHTDGFTRRSGTGTLSILRSRIDCSGPSTTGAFFLQDIYGHIDNVTLQDSYLEGNGYLMTLEARFGNGNTGFAINNVRCRSTEYGPVTTFTAGGQSLVIHQWSNVYVYSAVGVNGPGGKGGASIASP